MFVTQQLGFAEQIMSGRLCLGSARAPLPKFLPAGAPGAFVSGRRVVHAKSASSTTMDFPNQLVALKSMSKVVADTGDVNAMKAYSPIDCTTNPSYAALPFLTALPDFVLLMNMYMRMCLVLQTELQRMVMACE